MSYMSDGTSYPKGINIDINRHGLIFKKGIRTMNTDWLEDIAIHHTGGPTGTVKFIHDLHLENARGNLDGYGAAYNFYVRKDGSIHELRGLNYIGSHVAGRNSKSVGVCAEGDYSRETPSDTVYNSIALICAFVMQQVRHLNKIIPHNQSPGSSTECPGINMSMDRIRTLTKLKLDTVGDIRPIYGGNAASVIGDNPPPHLVYITTIGDTLSTVATKTSTDKMTLISLNPKIFNLPDGASFSDIAKIATSTGSLTPGLSIKYPGNAKWESMLEAAIMQSTADTFKYMSYSTVTMAMNDEDKFSGASYGNLTSTADYRASGDGKTVTIPSKKRTLFGQGDEKRSPLPPVSSSTSYDKMKIYVETDSDLYVYMFRIDPNQKNSQMNRNIQKIKTKGGFIISDEGRALESMSIAGVMLDYNGNSELMEFRQFYKENIASGNYKGIYLEMQGVISMIEIESVSISEGADNNMIKRYSMGITILNDNIMALKAGSGRVGVPTTAVGSETTENVKIPGSALSVLSNSIGISVDQY